MNITVNGYDLSPAVISGGTEGTNANERLTFTFDASWDGLIKTVTFYTPDRDVICLAAEDTVLLPWEVTRQSGVTRYVICGTDGEKTVMSTEGAIKISGTLNVDDETFERKTPGAIETITQYIKKITDAYDAAHADAENAAQMADNAERAASAAGDSRDGAVTAQTNAEKFASEASGSAQAAYQALQSAHASAESAIVSADSAQSSADSAQSFSQSADSAASSAQSSASSAHASAESAIVSAQNAQSSADSARSASQSAQSSAESAKAVYDLITEHDPVIGRFVNYEHTDVRVNDDGWRVLIRQIADTRVCVRFEHEQLKGDASSRIVSLYLKNNERYKIQMNNNEPHGFFDYRLETGSTPLGVGATDWYFDSKQGFIEVCLDTDAIAEISQTKELTVVSALIFDYSWNRLAEVKQIHFHLDESSFAIVDDALSETSVNPVQNRVVYAALQSANLAVQRCGEIAADAPIRKVRSVSASDSVTSVTVDRDTDNGQFDLSEFYARVTFKRPGGDTTETPIKFLVTGAAKPIELPIGSASERNFFIHGEASEDMLFISLLPENGVAGCSAGCVFTAAANGIRSFEISRSGDSKLGNGTAVDIWGRYAERM